MQRNQDHSNGNCYVYINCKMLYFWRLNSIFYHLPSLIIFHWENIFRYVSRWVHINCGAHFSSSPITKNSTLFAKAPSNLSSTVNEELVGLERIKSCVASWELLNSNQSINSLGTRLEVFHRHFLHKPMHPLNSSIMFGYQLLISEFPQLRSHFNKWLSLLILIFDSGMN